MASVPTFKEQGFNVTWKMFRGIIGPSGIPSDALGFYEALFKKLSDSSKWKDGYIKKYMLTPAWMGSQEATKFVEQVEQTCKTVLKELNLTK